MQVNTHGLQEDGTKITDFNKCDFQHMHAYITAEKEKKKSMSKEEKKAEKERITAEEEKCGDWGI